MATDGAALFVQVGEARRPVCLDPPKEGLVDLREEGKPGVVTVNAQRYQVVFGGKSMEKIYPV